MVLHFYQPPTQEKVIVHNILQFCYLPLLRMLSKKSGYGLTVNISGSLLSQLEEMQAHEFFDLITQLVTDKKIELISSAMNHPLIPVIPPFSVKRQIQQNDLLLKRLFGVKSKGFFPPELAIDQTSLDSLQSDYVIVDASGIKVKFPVVKYKDKYLLVNNQVIGEVLRSHPDKLQVKEVVDMLKDEWTVTANDSEVFGHHYVERHQLLSDLLDRADIQFISVSQALSKFGKSAKPVTSIKPSTWQTTKEFALWTNNPLQQQYLKMLNLIGQLPHDHKYYDQATASCHLYWLSNWPWWHPGLVEKGAKLLLKSVKSKKAERLYREFIQAMWAYHTSDQVNINYRRFELSVKKDT